MKNSILNWYSDIISLSPSLPPSPYHLMTSCTPPPPPPPPQMVARLKQQVQDLKDELSMATGEERTDELTDEEKAKYVTELVVPSGVLISAVSWQM